MIRQGIRQAHLSVRLVRIKFLLCHVSPHRHSMGCALTTFVALPTVQQGGSTRWRETMMRRDNIPIDHKTSSVLIPSQPANQPHYNTTPNPMHRNREPRLLNTWIVIEGIRGYLPGAHLVDDRQISLEDLQTHPGLRVVPVRLLELNPEVMEEVGHFVRRHLGELGRRALHTHLWCVCRGHTGRNRTYGWRVASNRHRSCNRSRECRSLGQRVDG